MGLASGGSQFGTNSKNTIAFTFKKEKEGVYTVTPKYKLPPGEYCFLYKGTVPIVGGFSNQSVFDFSVK